MTADERPRREFEILDCIGRGTFGTVYRARMLGAHDFSKIVALKVANNGDNLEVVERLRDEARMLALVQHRAIVRVDDLIEVDGEWAIAMEYVDGIDLGAVIGRQPVPCGPALEIAGEVAGALHAAFTSKAGNGRILRLVHRDVKPANILITSDGATRLLDFGIARATFAARESATLDAVYGSLGYMSPERLDGGESMNGDIYSLGVVLWEMLTRQRLGKSFPDRARHEEHRAGAADLLTSLRMPADVVELIRAMLAFAPADRPSMRDVERRCLRLRTVVGTESLREWTERTVPPLLTARRARQDGLWGPRQRFTGHGTPVAVERVASSGSGSREAKRSEAPEPAPEAAGPVTPAEPMPPAQRLPTFPTVALRPGRYKAVALLVVGAAACALLVAWGAARFRPDASVGAIHTAEPPAEAVATTPEADATPAASVDPVAAPVAPEAGPPATAPGAAAPRSSAVVSPAESPRAPTNPTTATTPTPPAASPSAAPGAPAPPAPNAARSAPESAPEPSASPSPTPTPSNAAVPVAGSVVAAPDAKEEEGLRGLVRVSGDASSVALVGSDGVRWPLPGPVPAGRYVVQASFGDAPVDAGTVEVHAGGVLRLTCDAARLTCAP